MINQFFSTIWIMFMAKVMLNDIPHMLQSNEEPVKRARAAGPKTATEIIRERTFGSDWGVHSPEIIESRFSTVMGSYFSMAMFHRQMYMDIGVYPDVYFNEHGEIIKIEYPVLETREGKKREIRHHWGEDLPDLYRRFGFFFEGERY